MKAVILAGGYGTRISEETRDKPKPMIEIGGKPILWHLLKIYSSYNVKEFIICCGYRGEVIKEYFLNYRSINSDITVDLGRNSVSLHGATRDDWMVTLVDTGIDTMTGGRLKAVRDYLGDDQEFLFTYGDGVSDVNIAETIAFHRAHRKKATLVAVKPSGRFGVLDLDEDAVKTFSEKTDNNGYINGGFFVLDRSVIDYIDSSSTSWERQPLERLASQGELMAFRHSGFWHPMDTLRDKMFLEEQWAKGAPWKVWAP